MQLCWLKQEQSREYSTENTFLLRSQKCFHQYFTIKFIPDCIWDCFPKTYFSNWHAISTTDLFFFICRMWTHTAKIQRDSSRLKAVSSCAMSCWLLRHGEEWGWRWRESGAPALLKGRWKREQRELPTESNFTEQYELLTPEPPLHTHHITFMVSVFEKLAYLVLEFCS